MRFSKNTGKYRVFDANLNILSFINSTFVLQKYHFPNNFWTLGSKMDSGETRPFFTFSVDLLASCPYRPLSFSHSDFFGSVLCHKKASQAKPQKMTTKELGLKQTHATKTKQ